MKARCDVMVGVCVSTQEAGVQSSIPVPLFTRFAFVSSVR